MEEQPSIPLEGQEEQPSTPLKGQEEQPSIPLAELAQPPLLQEDPAEPPSTPLPRRPWRLGRWQMTLTMVLVVFLIGGTILYSQWRTINSLVTGTHIPVIQASVVPLQLPPGFHADVFASELSGPRFMTLSPDGTLFSTERGTGTIMALPDPQHTGQATQKIVVVSGLSDPTSLAFYQGALYVGESNQVSRFTIGSDFKGQDKTVVVPHLPTGGNHVTRTVLIGPDHNLYVSIGSTCNVCNESDAQRATIWQYHLDGSGGRLYARGLRNAVGLALNPWNQQIWATNNGRDLLGDDLPPETLYALQDGGNYGWPLCHAGDLIDPDLGHAGDCDGVVKPEVKMQAHSAPLGLAFYQGKQFPARYRGVFVAFHGSWNRSIPTGYKVIFIPLNAQGAVTGSPQDFATGWFKNKDTIMGRPVGLTVGSDGELYVSDDGAGMIYRITYKV